MSKFIIIGGSKLSGEIQVNGSKNAALAVIAGSLLTRETCIVRNVPEIQDVKNFLLIIEHLGGTFKLENHTLEINCANLQKRELPAELVASFRGSILLAGVLLARFGEASLSLPGGDAIGKRPIDVHIDGFRKLGAEVIEKPDGIELKAPDGLMGAKLVLEIASVTGTENLILAASMADCVTEIKLAATEPHVQDLCRFLVALGAKIQGIGTPDLRILGVDSLGGTEFILVPDEIEAVTLCAAAAVTGSAISVTGVDLNNLEAPLAVMERMGVNLAAIEGQNGGLGRIEIRKPAKPYASTKIITGIFPKLLTDEQPLLGVLATQAVGETTIHDWIYEGRQGYLKSLMQMGAKVQFDDVHRARIYGPTPL